MNKVAELFIVIGLDPVSINELANGNEPANCCYLNQEIYPQVTNLKEQTNIPKNLHLFSFPQNVENKFFYRFGEAPDSQMGHFVTTDQNSKRMYATFLSFYELASRQKIRRDKIKQAPYCVPKALILVSQQPMFIPQKQFLEHLRDIICPQTSKLHRNYNENIIYREDYRELYISTLLYALPETPYHEILVMHYPNQFIRGGRTIQDGFLRYRTGETIGLNIPNYQFHLLLQSLKPENIIDVIEFLLLEKKIVLISEDVSKLVPVAESFISLLYPFLWQNVYIPYLPTVMLDVLEAPVPFFIGILKENYQKIRNTSEIIFVDLDTKTITSEEELPSLPAPACSLLYKDLCWICNSLEKMLQESEIITAVLMTKQKFLNFFIQILKFYRSYINTKNETNGQEIFFIENFVKIFEDKDFIRQFFNTQMFTTFIDQANRPFDRQPKEIQYFNTCLEVIEKYSLQYFMNQQQKEIFSKVQAFENPQKISLFELFQKHKPEPEQTVQEQLQTPKQARFIQAPIDINDPDFDGLSTIMEEGVVSPPTPSIADILNFTQKEEIQIAFKRLLTNQ